MSSRPKVLLLAGFPNSGTTIASFVLGQHHDVFVAGELADFPAKQLKVGRLCACGSPAAGCAFWAAVMHRLTARSGQSAGARRGDLYRAIQAESGATLIVDVAHDLHALGQAMTADGIDLRLVHLRRRSEALLNSRMRRFGRPGDAQPRGLAPRFRRAFHHVVRSHTYDRAADALRRRMGKQRAIAIRYEVLCREPETALAAIGRVASIDFTGIGDRLASEPLKPMSHMIRGNPRLKANAMIYLAADDGFRRELTLSDRFACLAASSLAPALRKHRRWQVSESGLHPS